MANELGKLWDGRLVACGSPVGRGRKEKGGIKEEYEAHIELALPFSFLGDVGGGAISEEIIKANGIDNSIRMGAEASKEGRKDGKWR